MKYKIDNRIIYDVTDSSLTTLDNDCIKLSITANALLCYLVSNQRLTSRDEILKHVWDDNGLTSSNANLNQYVSILRKSFRQLSIENVILSIPKGGLQINPELVIEIIEDLHIHPSIPKVVKESKNNNPLKLNIREQDKKNLFLSIVFVVISIVLIFYYFNLSNTIELQSLYPMKDDKCEVYSTEKVVNDEMRSTLNDDFNLIRESLGIECNENRGFVFFNSDKFKKHGLGRTFFSQCVKNDMNSYAYCDNYYYYNWKL